MTNTSDIAYNNNDHNVILCPLCKTNIEQKVKNMLVEYLGFCYYPYFKKMCIVYKKNNIEIVRDITKNKIICLIYSGIVLNMIIYNLVI